MSFQDLFNCSLLIVIHPISFSSRAALGFVQVQGHAGPGLGFEWGEVLGLGLGLGKYLQDSKAANFFLLKKKKSKWKRMKNV